MPVIGFLYDSHPFAELRYRRIIKRDFSATQASGITMALRFGALIGSFAVASAAVLPRELFSAAGRGGIAFSADLSSGVFAAGKSDAALDIVRGKLDDQLTTVGWIYLDLATNESYTDLQQAYAAGYAEGAATVTRTWQSFINQGVINATLPAPVVAWLENNTAFSECRRMVQTPTGRRPCSVLAAVHTQILAHVEEPYWHHVSLLLAQVQGLADGYNDHAAAEQRKWEVPRTRTPLAKPRPLSTQASPTRRSCSSSWAAT